ncbi:hypothetical protein BDZ45DRAFT_679500 [Acephala macrosclerotiorum]|nr:hypothetical protein BDZ45DRAFT_679500 [Acephala macrosclerotiorum]
MCPPVQVQRPHLQILVLVPVLVLPGCRWSQSDPSSMIYGPILICGDLLLLVKDFWWLWWTGCTVLTESGTEKHRGTPAITSKV